MEGYLGLIATIGLIVNMGFTGNTLTQLKYNYPAEYKDITKGFGEKNQLAYWPLFALGLILFRSFTAYPFKVEMRIFCELQFLIWVASILSLIILQL